MLRELIPIVLAQAGEAAGKENPLIDWTTVIFQVINFGVLLLLLRIFLYKRIVQALDQRQQRIKEQFDQAERREAEAAGQKEAFEQKQRQIEDQREQMIADAEGQAEKRRKQLLDQARQEVDRKTRQWQDELVHRREALLQEIRRTTTTQACRIARRVIAELADEQLESRMVERFIERLKSLEGRRVEEIRQAVDASDGSLVLASAFEMSSADKGKITSAVHSVLETDRDVDYVTDAQVICGLELRAPGYEVAWSADEYIDDLEQQLSELIEHRTATAPEASEEDEPAGGAAQAEAQEGDSSQDAGEDAS